jgi:ankyrin repeat protein
MLVSTRKILFLSLICGSLIEQLACAEEAITARDYNKFYASVLAGDIVSVDNYLSKGLNPNWKEGPYKASPLLHQAARCLGDPLEQAQQTIIKKLLDAGINPNSVDISRHDNALILLTYCKENNLLTETAQLLIDKGADPKQENRDKNTAFRLAVSRDNESLALLLLPLSNVEKKDIERAMLNDMHVLVSSFIKQRYYLYDLALIEWAVRHGFEDVLIELLNAGADPNSFLSPDKNYTYPIIYAANLNQTRLVKIFHQYGADINVIEKGMGIKDIAIKRNNTDLLIWLENLN